jgi:hypothetical protein
LQSACKRQADHGDGTDQHTDRDQPVPEFAHSWRIKGPPLGRTASPQQQKEKRSFLADFPSGHKRGLLGREACGRAVGRNNIYRATNERRRGLGEPLRHFVAIRIGEGNVAAFEVAEVAQPVPEGVPPERVVDDADARDLRRQPVSRPDSADSVKLAWVVGILLAVAVAIVLAIADADFAPLLNLVAPW